MRMRTARRIEKLPPYLFAEIDKKVALKKAEGVDVISVGIGDPDRPTPEHIVETMRREAANPENHRYPSYYGLPEFRQAIASWYRRRFGVELNPNTEVLPLVGSKEGIAHIYLAFVDEGDEVLVPDPGYPVYQSAAILSGGAATFVPLTGENDFNPVWADIPAAAAQAAKLMFLNYPNNPTSAIARDGLLDEAVAFARETDTIICYDNAYSELTFDGYVAPSFLETPGAKEVGIEFHSLSKTYNMTGWRIGWAVGNADVIEAFGRVKTNIDSGIFNAVQKAGVAALEGPQDCIADMCALYQERRDRVMGTLADIGLSARTPKGSVYVWVNVPHGYDSAGFATHILEQAGVVVSPGNAYGPSGEGFFRISLTTPDDRLSEALDRIRNAL